MGVRGLKSFVERHDGLFVKDHHLHDTHVIIDAANLMCALYIASQKHERRDLFGGDMCQYGRYLESFFGNLRRCQVIPILVFDGAQTHDQNKSKTAEKHRRALDRFQSVMSINKLGFGDFILPATASNVFKSVAVDQQIRIVQCMYEADSEVARIANELKCPVISNDSDFFLMNLPYGLITIDLLQHEQVKRCLEEGSSRLLYSYINCWLFKQESFLKYLPGLDIDCLPLLGILAGNDYIASNVLEKVCSRLSSYHNSRDCSKNFKKLTGNRQHQKIVNILHFLRNKTRSEIVNLVCAQAPREQRLRLKALIKSNLLVYDIPDRDEFELELRNLYWRGFQATYMGIYDEEELSVCFDRTIKALVGWLRNATEKSVSGYRCLELANQNIIFVINHMDDPQLPTAHECQIRALRVTLALLKPSKKHRMTCVVYDRIGQSYSKKVVKAMDRLENYGALDCFTFFDLPRLPVSVRQSILLATFHTSWKVFENNIADYYEWFEPDHAEEVLSLKLIMDFVDTESQLAKIWRHFRQATMLCLIYYLYKTNKDQRLTERMQEIAVGEDVDFMNIFSELVKRRKLDKMPTLNKRRRYNCRIMHQITQLQSSIISFNGLNAFLGDVMTRFRLEHWLNSCLIYNLTEMLHEKTLKLSTMPEIIHLRPRCAC